MLFRKYLNFIVIFIPVFLLMLLAEETENQTLVFIVKPLILLSLGFYFYLTTKLISIFDKLIFAGLVFSWTGDILLMFVKWRADFFIFGLIAFLLAHVSYTLAFLRHFSRKQFSGYIVTGIMVIFSTFFFSILQPHLGKMQIPVLVYVLAISAMTIAAGFRKTNPVSFSWILIGAVFFVVSDASLAYNKFVTPVSHAGTLIMSTYMIAQFLIAFGAIFNTNILFNKAKED